MKIGHFFDAIEVTEFVPSAFRKLFIRSTIIARFGRQLEGLHDNPVALGSALLKATDLFKDRSGLTDDHRVLFSLEEIKRDHPWMNEAAIGDHLGWMIDSRRNSETINLVLDVINDSVPRNRAKSFTNYTPTLSIQRLARDLLAGLKNPDERELTEALLTGRLYLVREKAQRITKLHPNILRRVREMFILWALLDMQIMATRLFHAEHFALETGDENDPTLMTIQTINDLILDLSKKAKMMVKAFASRKNDRTLRKELDAFIKDNGLEGHARRNAKSMGISDAELVPGAQTPELRKKLSSFLKHLDAETDKLVQGFGESTQRGTKTVTRVDFAKEVNSTQKLKFASKPLSSGDKKKGTEEAKLSASTTRFSMPVLTALAYSVRRVTSAIASLPVNHQILSHDAAADALPALWDDATQAKIRQGLLGVYRHLFTRDHRRISKSGQGPFVLPSHDEPNALVKVADAQNLSAHKSAIFGVGQSPSDIMASDKASNPKGTWGQVSELEEYRRGNHREPEDEYIDRLFECSLGWRLEGSFLGGKE